MKGEWANHPKFGEQFKLSYYKTTTPASVHGIEKYLGSGLIKGIGPVMAKRIVKLFGEATLDVIEADIQKLVEVPGIGSKRIGMISQAWEEQKEIRSVMLFLQTHGVNGPTINFCTCNRLRQAGLDRSENSGSTDSSAKIA